MMKSVPLAFCLALSGCSLLGGTKPARIQSSRSKTERYLKGGPTTEIDLGPGQTSLLGALEAEKDRVSDLTAKLKKLRQELMSLNLKLAKAERERDKEHVVRVAAEAHQSELSRKLRQRETRILNLALEKVKLEQEVLVLKITATEKLLEAEMRKGGAGGDGRPGR
ncbi:MAG: hypothetical protein ACE5F1_12735 [Planctomycetota bacterium]